MICRNTLKNFLNLFGDSNMRSLALALMTALMLSACWSPGYRANMMADGNTWDVAASDYSLCGGSWHSTDDCFKNLMPLIERRSVETCGQKPVRIYNCGHRRPNEAREVGCSVQCKEAPIVQIQEPVSPAQQTRAPNSEILKKAKVCQKKGGVWINDRCQIDINGE